MSTKPKFDPSLVVSLLNRGAEEGRGVLPTSDTHAAAPISALASVPQPARVARVVSSADAGDDQAVDDQAVEAAKRPITIRLTEEVLHALLRHQADVRCRPGVRLGPTTIGGLVDTLLRGPLGLST